MAEMKAENKNIAHRDENEKSEVRNGDCSSYTFSPRRNKKGCRGQSSMLVQSSPAHTHNLNGCWPTFFCGCFLLGFSGGEGRADQCGE